MTTPIQTLREYRADRRLDSKNAGRALVRAATGFGSAPEKPRAMVFTQDGSLRFTRTGGRPQALNRSRAHELLAELFIHPEDEFHIPSMDHMLIADRPTRAAFTSLLAPPKGQLPTQEEEHNQRSFEALGTVRLCRRVRILTELMSFRYWLPDGMDTESLNDWTVALGARSMTPLQNMVSLEQEVVEETVAVQKALLTRFDRSEVWLIKQAPWRSMESKLSVLGSLTSVNTLRQEVEHLTPGLQEEFSRNGDLCEVASTPADETTDRRHFTVIGPCKLGEGKKVRILNKDGSAAAQGEITLMSIQDGQAELRIDGRSLKAGLSLESESYYLSEIPFFGKSGRVSEGRWMGLTPKGEGPPMREIPMDIVQAGAPQSI